MKLLNWAGNIEFGAQTYHEPTSIEQVQSIVGSSAKVRPIGTRHSFNRIADSEVTMLSLRKLPRQIDIDRGSATVTVDGGITYAELCPTLEAAGFALPNLASLPHISVVGAVSTATHGSGVTNRNLASSVSGIEFVAATGELTKLTRANNPDVFDGAIVTLGALGVFVRITLDLEPSFRVRQDVYEGLPFAGLEDRFDEVISGAYSVSLFTDWTEPKFNLVWRKSRQDWAPKSIFEAQPAIVNRHPIDGLDAIHATPQLGEMGPWNDRLPHFRAEFTPSSGAELQSEYFIDRRDAVDAIRAVQTVSEEIAPLLFVTEIRTVAADELWLSPNYQRDSVAIHFTWHQDWEKVRALLPKIDALLAPFAPRPHWGKLFTLENFNYPKISPFKELRNAYDPHHKFVNDFVAKILDA